MSLTEQERIERRRGYERKYWENPANKHKDAARRAVAEALAKGRLYQPLSCQRCGMTTLTEAHHPDYSQPLLVQWLCVPCHRAHHRETHCKHGHEYTSENTYLHNGDKRHCGECARIRARKYHHAKKIKPETHIGFDPPGE